MNHTVKFYRNAQFFDWFSADCTCGWKAEGESLAELQSFAATHDLDDFECLVDAPATTPPTA